MDSIIDLSDPSKALDLANIRYQLIRLEDTITFHLIERVQFPLNRTIYQPGAIPILEEAGETEDKEKEKEKQTNGEKATNGDSAGAGAGAEGSQPLSFMDWYLREQEKLQSLIRRYESPDEYPFFPAALRKPILKPVRYPQILHPNTVNVNAEIKRFYTERFLPAACPDFGGRADRGPSGENYGSSATCDIACLQALSRRVHFGKFVAESKFRSDPDTYTRLIRAGDRRGIGDAITNAAVEKQVLARLELKAQTYGRDPTDKDADSPSKINAQAVVSMYRDFVIPLTKEVEVEYLMQRLD